MDTTAAPSRESLRVQQAATAHQRRLLAAVAPKLVVALVLVALADAGAWWWLNTRVRTALDARLSSSLRAFIDTHAQVVRTWYAAQLKVLDAVVRDAELKAASRELLALTPPPNADELRERLRERLRVIAPWRPRYTLTTPDGVVVASTAGYEPGRKVPGGLLERLRTAPRTALQVLPPFLVDEAHAEAADLARLDFGEGLAGFLVLHLEAEDYGGTLSRGGAVLQTGELFAFDRDGRMLSESRFPDALRQVGALPPAAASTVLQVELKDPGVDAAGGVTPSGSRARLPLTRLAAAATAGESGEDLKGYRNARGAQVVGVWRWLDEQGVGIGAELELSEAWGPRRIITPLLSIVLGLLGLFAFAGIGLLVLFREEARRAKALGERARVLGQYQLGARLGEGGMGVVYEAKHALLHRRAAIKLMQPGRFSPTQLARFEREVQATASLGHPNTIAIYDFGRADDGTFYYVMELLDGSDLHDVVRKTGVMGSARAAFVLRQVLGSVAEAHANGMVHRDIKPSNIFLSQRSGLYDFAKLLDFGLVKSASPALSGDAHLTATNALLGTPAFMAPELFESPENASPKSDLYALGCVIYWMLTGRPIFEAFITDELAEAHKKLAVKPPSAVSGLPVDPALEALAMQCLAKKPEERPASAEAMLAALDAVAGRWTTADARDWWQRHGAALGHQVVSPLALPATLTEPGTGPGAAAVTRPDR
ncbi:MAG: serine/threonine-protein kinase [Myxococcota bacterium]